jgi:Biotin-requiring enzyme.
MKKIKKMLALMGLAGAMTLPVNAAEMHYTSILSGTVASVAAVGTEVREGDVLLTVNTLTGPMAAARAQAAGIVKSVSVSVGTAVNAGDTVLVLETE